MVKNYDKLPSFLKDSKRPHNIRICNIKLDESLAKDEELATGGKKPKRSSAAMFVA